MEITASDRERFLEAFKWYKECSTEVAQAHVHIQAFLKGEGAAALPSGDINTWDPVRAERIVAAQHTMADAYERLSKSLRRQADAMSRTARIAEEIIKKLETMAPS